MSAILDLTARINHPPLRHPPNDLFNLGVRNRAYNPRPACVVFPRIPNSHPNLPFNWPACILLSPPPLVFDITIPNLCWYLASHRHQPFTW